MDARVRGIAPPAGRVPTRFQIPSEAAQHRYNICMGTSTTTLWRPVGRNELALIDSSGYREFPPRLPEQPIFYPVLNFAYAERIARDWNSTDARHAYVGFVTRFVVASEFLTGHETHQVGDRTHVEYWIPAEDLGRFNSAIQGLIEVVSEYRHGQRTR